MSIFKALANVEWNEEPVLTLHEWRVRLPCSTSGKGTPGKLQIEFMRLDKGERKFCSMLVSHVNEDGSRGDEQVLVREELLALRELLNASDLLPLEGEE